MKNKQALSEISQAMGRLRHEIGLENAAGYFSQNKLLENLFLPVFRIVLDAPDLRNANESVANVAYIDLVDDQKKLSLQITTDNSAAKVTETLEGFLNAKRHRSYKRLKFFVFASQQVGYQTRSAKKWSALCKGRLKFSPKEDVIQCDDLFRLISNLKHAELVKVRDILAQSVVGEEFVDVAAAIAGQAQRQVDNEKQSGKYIPEVFTETSSVKSLARLFWHPLLFFERVLDDVDRRGLQYFNRLLERCGLPTIPVPSRQRYVYGRNLPELLKAVELLRSDLLALESAIDVYRHVDYREPPPFPPRPGCLHYYEQNAHHIGGWYQGTQAWIKELRQELNALSGRVFIMTGKAGQGKTNFVCDLVSTFALRYGIPCAYFTGLQLGRVSTDLPEHVRIIIFKNKLPTFADVAKTLSGYASSCRLPFVFVFEGLNEHTRLQEFAGQLEELIKSALPHPWIRFFFTCRSEYFDRRFGNLLRSSFKSDVCLLESTEQYLDNDQRQRMLEGYFNFYGIDQALVSEQAKETLRPDTLLLRFFCEVYGKRNRPASYIMPEVFHIHRAQIFDYYFKAKLRSAADARERYSSSSTIRGTESDLSEVIRLIVSHMVTERNFADVPVSVIPADKREELVTLLGEDIILRRDPSPDPTDLLPSRDVLNFTYDEFRDFLIAKFAVSNLFKEGHEAPFLNFLALGEHASTQISEGIKRFLFYWARQKENVIFRQFYSALPAYDEVYADEIFSIDNSQLDKEDESRVRAILEGGARTATVIAASLIRRWHPVRYPFLNLELLIKVIGQGDDSRHNHLIEKNFRAGYVDYERVSATGSFCASIEKYIIPQFDAGVHKVLFDFLPTLFPIEVDGELDSPTVRAFRRLAAVVPGICISALLRSLDFAFTGHRAFVWRLMTELQTHLPDRGTARMRAQSELASADPATAVEINRFLKRAPSL